MNFGPLQVPPYQKVVFKGKGESGSGRRGIQQARRYLLAKIRQILAELSATRQQSNEQCQA